MSDDKLAALRLRESRKSKRLTQQDLADLLQSKYGIELSGAAISMYETGARRPSIEMYDAFHEIFDVSVDWLRGHSEIRNPDKQLAALNYPADVIDLADKLNAVSNGLRRFIVGYAGELLGKCALLQNRQMAHVKEMLESNGLTDEWEAEHHINVSG